MSNTQPTFEGRFRIVAIKPDGTERVLADWFKNLITNVGLNYLGTNETVSTVQVGSGNTTPVVGDSQLNAKVAETTSRIGIANGSATSAPYYGWVRGTWRFATGVAAGNLSEVSIGWGTGGAYLMFSRALILDGDGNPTTITVLSNEILDVSYEFRAYAPTQDTTGTINIAGVDYAYTARAADVLNWGNYVYYFMQGAPYRGYGTIGNGPIGTVTQSPSNSQSYGNEAGLVNYVNNSLERGMGVGFGIDQGNFGGVKSLMMIRYSVGAFQFEFNPVIPKDNTKTLTLYTKYSWARKVI